MDAAYDPTSFVARWRAYFHERFPLLGHGVPLAVFVLATLAYARSRHDEPGWPGAATYLAAFVTVFLAFLQLRILDEFKDFADDARHRPELPVPRGLVTLRGLAGLGLAAGAVQLAATLPLGAMPAAALLAFWGFAALMRVEFFAPAWLRTHPASYLAAHMLVVPLIVAYVATCGGGAAPLSGLGDFMAMSYFTFCVFEIGRKIRAPSGEREGVDTYSGQWGLCAAVLAWLGAMLAALLLAALAAHPLGYAVELAATGALLAVFAALAGYGFVRAPRPGADKRFPALSGAWLVGVYVAFALIALAGPRN